MYGRHQQCAWIVFAKHKMLFTQKFPLKRNALHVSVSSAARVAVFHIISWALWFELFRFGKRRQSTILSIGKYFISRLVFVDHCSTAIPEKAPPSSVYSYKWNCVEPFSTMLVFLHNQDTHQIIYQMACWYFYDCLTFWPYNSNSWCWWRNHIIASEKKRVPIHCKSCLTWWIFSTFNWL